MNTLNVSENQRALAKKFSSILLIGPPMGEKLIRLVAHLFADEEAAAARHLPFYIPGSLKKIARRARTGAELIRPILDSLADRKIILRTRRGYSLLPLVPGMFEYMLVNGVDSEWHRQYAVLLNDLFASGYVKHYTGKNIPGIRNIPVAQSAEIESRVMDAAMVSEMIESHDDLAVAKVCQCRQSLSFAGSECKRADVTDGCLIFGSFARGSVRSGSARAVTRDEMKEIVEDRRRKNLVFLTGNVSAGSPNAICTCCDCCCHFIEAVNHFQGDTFLAPPISIASVDESQCNNCGRCVKSCNTNAHTLKEKIHYYDKNRCIGCGLCVDSCRPGAIRMKPNSRYRKPAKDFKNLGLKLLPGLLVSGVLAWFSRRIRPV